MHLDSGPLSGPIDWEMEYRLGPDTLKNFNPLPLMIHIMMEVPGLRAMGGQLYTVMAELFSNSFEHGVLGLDSSLKNSADGFVQYYREREKQLQVLQQGHIHITLSHQGDGRSGALTIRIEDSGAGFDYGGIQGQKNPYSGRGIPLISQVCESLNYLGKGNIVEAVIRWPVSPDKRTH